MNKHSFIRFYYLFEDFDSEYPLGKVWGVKEEGERGWQYEQIVNVLHFIGNVAY